MEDKEALRLLPPWIKEKGVTDHQGGSFDWMLEHRLSDLSWVRIDPIPLQSGKVLHFLFGHIQIKKPLLTEDDQRVVTLTPLLAKQRGENYSALMYVDIHVFTSNSVDTVITKEMRMKALHRRTKMPLVATQSEDGGEQPDMGEGVEELEIAPGIMHCVVPSVYLAPLPIPIGSRACHLYGLPQEKLVEMCESIWEPGGHFILRGKERVIVPQKGMAHNTLFISRDKPASTRTPKRDTFTCVIHAQPERPNSQVVVNKLIFGHEKAMHDSVVRVAIKNVYFGKGVPLHILLVALGMPNWQTAIRYIAMLGRLDEKAVAKALQSTHAEGSMELMRGEENGSGTMTAWRWLSTHISNKQQRWMCDDPLPEHPQDQKITHTFRIIHQWLLPHVLDGMPQMEEPEHFYVVCKIKAIMICWMMGKLLRVAFGIDEPTDRDKMENKRYETPGSLMFNLICSNLRPQLSDFRTQIIDMDKNKKPIDIRSAMCSERLQKALSGALRSGKFVQTRGNKNKNSSAAGLTGVSQALTYLNPLSAISDKRKLTAPSTQKTPADARQLKTSYWGKLCISETPEGQPCGIVNHLAMLSYFSFRVNSSEIVEWLVEKVPSIAMIYDNHFDASDSLVTINGRLVASVPDEVVQKLIRDFRQDRFTERLPATASISLQDEGLRVIQIFCDGGRLCRPLCRVENRQLLLQKSDIDALYEGRKDLTTLFMEGKFEFLDGAETEDSYIATFFSETSNADYTHCEIAPFSIFGISAGLTPFANFNQSPRVVYNAGMSKQAFGVPSMPLHNSFRPTQHVLEHPELPMVDTILQRIDELPFKWMPTGQNCIVFVMPFGYNMEDSLVFSKSSIERGLFRSHTGRIYMQTAQRNDNATSMESERFEKPVPEKTSGYKTELRYDRIEADGFVVPGNMHSSDSVLIGKTSPLLTPVQDPSARNRSVDRSNMFIDPNYTRKDSSLTPRKKGDGYVTSVMLTHTHDARTRVVVEVRTHRQPVIGDKFSSRHGQKGTIGTILPDEALPITLDGVTPDIVMNPHAFPSRMTLGQTPEGMLGNIAAKTGTRRDATAFFCPSFDEISDEMFMLKLDPTCERRILHWKTGELMESGVYVGTIYYQALKHLVNEKVHARARGPVTKNTRQPVEGRRREGGLRVGEMETWAMISHGEAAFTLERTMEQSDAFDIPICTICGSFGIQESNSLYCRLCDSRDNVVMITIPYPTKSFKHYLLTLGIDMIPHCRRIETEPENENA